jgi:hypothetical protein
MASIFENEQKIGFICLQQYLTVTKRFPAGILRLGAGFQRFNCCGTSTWSSVDIGDMTGWNGGVGIASGKNSRITDIR